MILEVLKVLYISSKESDAEYLRNCLNKFEGAKFNIEWKESGESALTYLETNPKIDVIITEDALTGMGGIEFTRKLKEFKIDIPVVFLASSKEVTFAVEAIRIGAKDYFLKEDMSSRVLPQALLRIVETQRLKKEFTELEIKKRRLEAMQEIVVNISTKISEPLVEMNKIVNSLEQYDLPEKVLKYLNLIKENIERMQNKLEKLQNLKDDKTVKYIKDIKMIDLS